jgi:hypothetical protein
MMPLDKAIGPSRRQESIWGDKHIEKQFQKNSVPGRNIITDESTVGFKRKIIFETYNPKKKTPTKLGISLFALAESDTGYVHSIIPNYGKLTGMCVTYHTLKNR